MHSLTHSLTFDTHHNKTCRNIYRNILGFGLLDEYPIRLTRFLFGVINYNKNDKFFVTHKTNIIFKYRIKITFIEAHIELDIFIQF